MAMALLFLDEPRDFWINNISLFIVVGKKNENQGFNFAQWIYYFIG